MQLQGPEQGKPAREMRPTRNEVPVSDLKEHSQNVFYMLQDLAKQHQQRTHDIECLLRELAARGSECAPHRK